MTDRIETVKPGRAQVLVDHMPDGNPLLKNTDTANGVWIGVAPNVSPGFGQFLRPFGFINWTQPGARVYACVDTGVLTPVSVLISDTTTNPQDPYGVALAVQNTTIAPQFIANAQHFTAFPDPSSIQSFTLPIGCQAVAVVANPEIGLSPIQFDVVLQTPRATDGSVANIHAGRFTYNNQDLTDATGAGNVAPKPLIIDAAGASTMFISLTSANNAYISVWALGQYTPSPPSPSGFLVSTPNVARVAGTTYLIDGSGANTYRGAAIPDVYGQCMITCRLTSTTTARGVFRLQTLDGGRWQTSPADFTPRATNIMTTNEMFDLGAVGGTGFFGQKMISLPRCPYWFDFVCTTAGGTSFLVDVIPASV